MINTRNIKVSIIIACHYDNQEYIERSINSALVQNFPKTEYEIILSSDNCEQLKKYAEKFNIKFICNTGKKSLANNLNNCIKYCLGEYIKIIAYDDELTSNCINDLYNYAISNKADFIVANSYVENDKTNISENPYIMPKKHKHHNIINNYDGLIYNCYIHGATWLIKTNILKKIQFNTNNHTAEDYNFYFDYILTGGKIHHIDKFVSIHHLSQHSKSFNIGNGGSEKYKRQLFIIDNIKLPYLEKLNNKRLIKNYNMTKKMILHKKNRMKQML